MSSRWSNRRPRLAAGIVLLSLLAVVSAASVFHVPEQSFAAGGGRLYASGWHLRPPLRSVRIIDLAGRLEALDIDRDHAGEPEIRVRLKFNFAITPDRLLGRAAEIESTGIAGLARRVVAEALAPLPAAALLPSDAPASGRTLLPRAPRNAAARALRAVGIEPIDLDARVGPPSAFPAAALPESGLAQSGRRPMPTRQATGLRLLLVGLDGADWDVIDPLLSQRRLPHLARLLEHGARAALRSYDPMISPLLWTTIVTGVGPDRHGVADFQVIDPHDGRRTPISSRFRAVKALWNILGDADIDSAFVAWWASYPAEEVYGVQVSNLVAYEVLRPRAAGVADAPRLTHPPGYMAHIRPSLIAAADVPFDEVRSILNIERPEYEAARRKMARPIGDDEAAERRRTVQDPVPLTLSILAGSRNYATIAADLAAAGRPLTAVYFEGIDMMGHRFQHCMPPRAELCPAEDFRRYRDAVSSFYVRQDELLGEVLRAAGPKTTVMVVSDHGFKSGVARPLEELPFTTRQPVEWHDEEGIFILSGPAARPGIRLAARATLFDIAPTILYLLGLPIAEEMPGRVFLQALDPGFVERHPVRTIASYEPLGTPLTHGDNHSGADGAVARRAEEELLATLEALGYLGGGSPATPTSGSPRAASVSPRAAGISGHRPGGAAGRETQVFYHRNLATYFLKRNEYARAAEQLLLANQRHPLQKTYQMLSEAYLGMGKRREAIAALEEGLEMRADTDPESVLWLVRLHLEADANLDAARDTIARYGSRVREKPGLEQAIAGMMQEQEGNPESALRQFRDSLQADPLRVVVAQRLFALEPPETRTERLQPILTAALRRDPRIDEYHNLLGIILAERRQFEASLEAFSRAEGLDPDNPRFAANVAGALARLQRWEAAALAYEKSAIMAPSAATSMKLGSVYRRLRRPEMALTAFVRARDLGDDSRGPLLGMALAHSEMDQLAEALEVIRGGLEQHPKDQALRSLYSDLSRRLSGDPVGAAGS